MPRGLYIHVPFCNGKCPYCDFYSLPCDQTVIRQYTEKVCSVIAENPGEYDTVYFGGGTPSLLGHEAISEILSNIKKLPEQEITVECNPSDTGSVDSLFSFERLAEAGVNRISMGLQSAVDTERKALGRRGGCDDVVRAVNRAKQAGINNISLDVMLGIPGQTSESLKQTLNFCIEQNIRHVSAYMLKIEEGTPFFRMKDKLNLPDEDTVCDMYIQCCEYLEKAGLLQYEISNFSVPGFESKHNLKYWHCEEYLGIGPAAHSFIDGRRFCHTRSLKDFLNGEKPVEDGSGGSFEEYAMLALRLKEGLVNEKVKERFGFEISDKILSAARDLAEHNLVVINGKDIHITQKGFLISNSIIAKLIL